MTITRRGFLSALGAAAASATAAPAAPFELTKYCSAREALQEAKFNTFFQDVPLGFHDWMDEHFWLSAAATNTKGQMWKSYAWQRAIIHAIGDLDIEKVGVQKSVQQGISQILRAWAGYEAAHRKRSICIWQPRGGDAKEFSNVQIKTLLDDVAAVSDELSVPHDKKHTDNTVERRAFKGAQLFIKPAMADNNFRRFTCESGALDEYDGMPADIEGTGSPAKRALGRMNAADYRKLVVVSTPKIKGESNIETFISECVAQFRRFVPCPHCGHMQELIWGGADSDFGMKWIKVKRDDGSTDELATSKTVHYVCAEESCRGEFGYEYLRRIDAKGEWRSDKLKIIDGTSDEYEFRYLSDNTKAPAPDSVGFQIPGYFSYAPAMSWQQGCYDFLTAVRRNREGSPEDLITWTNEYQAATWSPIDNQELVEWETLKNRAEVYEHEVPAGVKVITAWSDVQDDRVEIQVVGWGKGEEAWSLFYIVINGDPHSGDLLRKAAALKAQEYLNENAAGVPTALFGMDSGYLADDVYSVCKESPTELIPTKGMSTRGNPVADMPQKRNAKGVYLTQVGTDTAKTIIAERLKLEVPGPGYIHFPKDPKVKNERIGDHGTEEHRGHTDSFYKMLTAEYKKSKTVNGQSVEYWHCPNGRRNEALDTMVGNLAMIRLLQTRYGIRLDKDTNEIEEADEDVSIDEIIKARNG